MSNDDNAQASPSRWAVQLEDSRWQIYPDHVATLLDATLQNPPDTFRTPTFELPVFPAMHRYYGALAATRTADIQLILLSSRG
jgi:hypothetical protein